MEHMSFENVITTDNLEFCYGERKAVDALSFTVRKGEVVGLLGPNGAGKTTTIRLLNGLLPPSAGTMQVLGFNPAQEGETLRQQTGVLTETSALYERLTARQNLHFFGTMAGMQSDRLAARIEEILEMFELTDRGNDRISKYSKGMKQRLALGRALLHNPELLFLDEPTSGLDPESSQNVMELIDTLRKTNGHSVLLCTHNLFEAQRLCDRVVIMNRGRLLAEGNLEELRARLSSEDLRLKLRFLQAVSTEKLAEVAQIRGVNSLTALQDDTFQLAITAEEVIPVIVQRLVDSHLPVVEVTPEQQSLEEIYFKLQQDAEEEIA